MKALLPVAGTPQAGWLVLPTATAASGRIALASVSGAPVPGAAAIGPAVVPGEGAGIVASVRTAILIASGTAVLMPGRSFRGLAPVAAVAAVAEGPVLAVTFAGASAEGPVPVSVFLPVTEVPARFFGACGASRSAAAAGDGGQGQQQGAAFAVTAGRAGTFVRLGPGRELRPRG